jgi:AraC family transcriptional regulator of adaptative response / DNA-3-methyladenine glycosylase II
MYNRSVLDIATCYRAVEARDRRFEGQFFLGVRTTGIYCRPGCPAPTPKQHNVRFFTCAAAAESAGFRACLRCRPDSLPGSPAWNGTSTTVARALRLIQDGGLDDANIDTLAARVGVGSRHLRRLFQDQVGTSPLAIARTRRAHFARKLIEETRLSMSDVALSAGFASVRSFNTGMRATFNQTPRQLRGGRMPSDVSGLRLRIPVREPYDWAGLLRYLRDRATAGVETVETNAYRRSIVVDGDAGILEVTRVPGAALELRLPALASPALIRVVARVAQMFDVATDVERIAADLRRDPLLRRALGGGPAPRIPVAWDPFELTIRAILGQQVSVRGATTLAGRLARAFGEKLPRTLASGSVTHLFPTPTRLSRARVERIGMPGARAQALRGVAAAVRDGNLRLDAANPEATVRSLVALPGIGDWTAQYVAMRGLGEPDAFPATDLGVLRALAQMNGLPKSAAVERRSARWRPWRAYATMALWRSGIGG